MEYDTLKKAIHRSTEQLPPTCRTQLCLHGPCSVGGAPWCSATPPAPALGSRSSRQTSGMHPGPRPQQGLPSLGRRPASQAPCMTHMRVSWGSPLWVATLRQPDYPIPHLTQAGIPPTHPPGSGSLGMAPLSPSAPHSFLPKDPVFPIPRDRQLPLAHPCPEHPVLCLPAVTMEGIW